MNAKLIAGCFVAVSVFAGCAGSVEPEPKPGKAESKLRGDYVCEGGPCDDADPYQWRYDIETGEGYAAGGPDYE
jgi:hypothetical protein